MARLYVTVRLTPADRSSALKALSGVLGRDVTMSDGVTGRCMTTAETVFKDVVRYGPRGFAVPMEPEYARKLADLLEQGGAADLADRFRNHQLPVRRACNGNWTTR